MLLLTNTLSVLSRGGTHSLVEGDAWSISDHTCNTKRIIIWGYEITKQISHFIETE